MPLFGQCCCVLINSYVSFTTLLSIRCTLSPALFTTLAHQPHCTEACFHTLFSTLLYVLAKLLCVTLTSPSYAHAMHSLGGVEHLPRLAIRKPGRSTTTGEAQTVVRENRRGEMQEQQEGRRATPSHSRPTGLNSASSSTRGTRPGAKPSALRWRSGCTGYEARRLSYPTAR